MPSSTLNIGKHYSYIKIIFSVGTYTSTVTEISVETTKFEFMNLNLFWLLLRCKSLHMNKLIDS